MYYTRDRRAAEHAGLKILAPYLVILCEPTVATRQAGKGEERRQLQAFSLFRGRQEYLGLEAPRRHPTTAQLTYPVTLRVSVVIESGVTEGGMRGESAEL